jgi:hypothetical protein
MADNYKETVKKLTLHEETFIRLTLKAPIKGRDTTWRRIVVRPVLVKGERHLQFSYFDERKDITKNYRGAEAESRLDEALAMPFSLIQVEATGENLQVQITKDGKAIFHRSKPSGEKRQPDLSHDRAKDLPLPTGKPDAFLQTLGIMNTHGQIRPGMHDKFAQINEFLKLLEHTGELRSFGKTPINVLDCGSGSSYLSFAVYHYLNNVLGIPMNLVGIDTNENLVDKSNANVDKLGFTQVCFRKSAIIDYVPEVPPDIVLALHACNTATDEALAQGIRWDSRLILSVPCCHHDLNEHLGTTPPFKPVFQHGILKERMADILTDTFRAQLLRIMGYKTDVVEFVSSEHTNRNLMIRAVKRGEPGDARLVEEYNALKSFWGVTPYLEKLVDPAHVILKV